MKASLALVIDTLRNELARAQKELDEWQSRASAARISLGAQSPVTAAADQMVEFWTKLRDTARAAVAKAERPVATLRLRPEDPR